MKSVWLMLGLVLLAVMEPAWAFRCGRYVISRGDHLYEVLDKCGEPEYVDRRVEYFIEGHRLGPHGLYEERQVPVEIEEWIYNFGRRRFKRFLRFENGVLKRIKILDYGH